ncbi:alginate lyase family protein [Pedobacter sp. FW305-3-2-15-E-R2A2]|uniref:alginate lyase family protein n=1 Tax=Pedobacter sp. FW305-3-2-15-E-R2A2 TaxID=3140251 RepID=UPI003140A6C0
MSYKLAILSTLLFLSFTGFAQRKTNKTVFILLDEQTLLNCKQQYQRKDATMVTQVNELIVNADSLLATGPYSVTFHKTKLASSGNKHDYISQAPYWWADPSKKEGRPYIRKDGLRNPEIYLLHDGSQMGKMCHHVRQLTLAYYFTGNEKYAEKVKSLLEVWFIASDTRMNPNLNYAQYIPGLNDGRGIGIIETAGLTSIPDMLAILQSSKNINSGLVKGIKHWYKQYLNWLQTSKNGKSERAQINNHGTYYDLQVVNYALFTGNEALAARTLKTSTILRIDQQFTTDGLQPLELVRTNSWGYSNMNLLGWCKLAIMAKRINIDLWHEQTYDGKGIKTAIAWLMPYALKEKAWRYDQIDPFSYGTFSRIAQEAAVAYPDISFNAFLEAHPIKNPLQNLN